ncbi:hypothetical protein EB815_25525 [Mesorhizobium loti]|nr:hypothetical protein EB815_25525 [Mesorhizobium loti]QKC91016.1 hypothetical protein EB230_23360 [Mesorhizobium sp. NZP2234]
MGGRICQGEETLSRIQVRPSGFQVFAGLHALPPDVLPETTPLSSDPETPRSKTHSPTMHRAHNGRELELMLQGDKPMASFSVEPGMDAEDGR